MLESLQYYNRKLISFALPNDNSVKRWEDWDRDVSTYINNLISKVMTLWVHGVNTLMQCKINYKAKS